MLGANGVLPNERSCFSSAVTPSWPTSVDCAWGGPAGRVYDRLGWQALAPMFLDVLVADELLNRLEDP